MNEMGELFLRSDSGKSYRLVCKGDAESPVLLSPGTYTLVGYRLHRGDWMISCTSPGNGHLKIRAQETTRLTLGPTIRVRFKAGHHGNALRLRMGIQGEAKMGLSIYRGGRRIPMPYVLEDEQSELTRGHMRYG